MIQLPPNGGAAASEMKRRYFSPEEQRMNQDEWLAALRSGKYKQGMGGGLRNPGYLCVLQVATEIVGIQPYYYVLVVSNVLGISEALYTTLYAMNDGWHTLNSMPCHQWTFPELADWFKEQRDAYNGDLREWAEVR